ncbi:hypothetical protein SUGI_0338760 [Cryptomeria japonica]|nr:hypothetical protein SUGI_0338760 [Cryptomeria japonica]
MDLARFVPSPFEVELDAIRFIWVFFWGTIEVLTLDFKGADVSFCIVFFHASPIEVEVLYANLKLNFTDMFMGSMPIPIVLVKDVLPFKMEILFGDSAGVYPFPIEVELGVVVDVRMYRWRVVGALFFSC